MFDLKKFLRFEISGYVAILYLLILCLVFFDLKQIAALGLITSVKLIVYSVSGFILAAPIGFIMHQIDISLFSPFRERRFLRLRKRKVIEIIRELLGNKLSEYEDKKCAAYLVEALGNEKLAHIKKEISNRYSYYYARMEASIFSPIVGWLLFLLIKYLVNSHYTECINTDSIMKYTAISWIAVMGITAISVFILLYIPVLFREIDDLECRAIEIYIAEKE